MKLRRLDPFVYSMVGNFRRTKFLQTFLRKCFPAKTLPMKILLAKLRATCEGYYIDQICSWLILAATIVLVAWTS